MQGRTINFQRITNILIICLISGYLLIIGKNFLMPLVFAGLFAFLLKPICTFIERWIPWRSVAILLTFLVVLLPIAGLISLFSVQLVEVFRDMPAISEKLKSGINTIFDWLNQQWGFDRAEGQQFLRDNLSKVLDAPVNILQKGIASSTNMLINFGLGLIYLFFFLLYRTSFLNFVLIQFDSRGREKIQQVVQRIQEIIQQYLVGLVKVIGILGLLNGLGLWLIGIDYPFFWGFLAACLIIIPYIGTALGGLLPFIFALATTSTFWQPLAIILMYAGIQQLEGNFITPKVVGTSVRVNPFAAILALILGGAFWGVAGLILSLPALAVIKIIFEQVDVLKPAAILLSSDLYDDREVFFDEYDEDRYRFLKVFRKKDRSS